MSRRSGLDINKVINTYKESKDRENSLKKENNKMADNIKAYFAMQHIDSVETDLYKATVKPTVTETLNDDLAIAIIKENLGGAMLDSVIKKKEYIDEDALEKLIYNGDFDVNKLAKAKMTKTTYTLRVTAKKG